MKYQIGDKVRVRQDLEDNKSYGNINFVDLMKEDKVITIYNIGIHPIMEVNVYLVKENFFSYTDEMLEGLVNSDQNNKCTCSIQDLMIQGCKCGGK